MIVVHTSAWIELLRSTRSPVDPRLTELLEGGSDVAVTEVVVAEVLAGARTLAQRDALRDRLLADCLIAFPAIRAGATVLHADRDFDLLATVSELRIEPVT